MISDSSLPEGGIPFPGPFFKCWSRIYWHVFHKRGCFKAHIWPSPLSFLGPTTLDFHLWPLKAQMLFLLHDFDLMPERTALPGAQPNLHLLLRYSQRLLPNNGQCILELRSLMTSAVRFDARKSTNRNLSPQWSVNIYICEDLMYYKQISRMTTF